MIVHLIAKEIREHLYGSRFLWYGITCILLITGSFYLGTLSYVEKQANYTSLRPDLENQTYGTAWRWRLPYHNLHFALQGVVVAVKPPVLQSVVQGTETHQNTIFSIAMFPGWGTNFPFVKHEKVFNPQGDFIPPSDFALVCTFLLSVLVLIFSYNVVSRERETGTLKLLLSCPVSRSYILFAKLAGGYLVVILPVSMAFLVCLLIVQVHPFYALTPADTAAFGIIMIYAALYLLVLYAAGVLVSTVIKRSSTAIAVLLLIWLVFIVVLHNGSLIMMRSFTKSDPLFTLIQDLKRPGRKWSDLETYTFAVHNKPLSAITGEEMVDLYRTGMAREQKEYVMPVLEKHINQVENDMRIVRALQFFSPSLLLESSVTEMAGTGIRNYLYMMRELYDYLNYFRENVVVQTETDLKYADKNKYMGRYYNLPKGQRPPLIYEEYTKFKPGTIGLEKRIEATMWNAFALICYAVVIFMAAFYVFIRTDIT